MIGDIFMSNNKAIVFMVMPFSEDYLSLYNHLKEYFKDNFLFTNAGDLDNQQNILQDIIEGIGNADVVIADLTNLNPNVFYELGLAHAMNKKVIIITQDINDLPFDLRSYRAVEYSLQFNKLPDFENELKKLLPGAIDGTIKFGNPVTDYLPDFKLLYERNIDSCENEIVTENLENEEQEEGEDGFLDYIAEIEENTNLMTEEINAISEEMEKMTNSIDFSNNEIDRVNSLSGQSNGKASFIRGICRKLSVPVISFSDKFNEHTSKIENYWLKVENNYLKLLDDKHLQSEVNIKSMKTSINALDGMKNEIYDSNLKMKGFISSMQGCMGLERKLTQAITSLISETENYLSISEGMASSIDRICARSEVVFKNFNSKDNAIDSNIN